jgi:DNA polymerase-3 subunit gamma/tau
MVAPVRGEDVRQMLGLADRARVIDLFEALMRGDIAAALPELRDQYDTGADPAVLLADLAEFTHFVTRVKIVPAVADDVSLSESERMRGRAFAAGLSMRVLSRTWQMLLKGIGEVQAAPRPIAAAEMVLVRIAYAADLPTPDDIVRSLGEASGGNGGAPVASASSLAPMSGASVPGAARFDAPRGTPRTALAPAAPEDAPVANDGEPGSPTLVLHRFEDLIALAAEKRDLGIRSALERDVRLVRFEDGKLEIGLEPSAAKTLVGELSRKLSAWTGRRWMVAVSAEPGAPSIRAQTETRKAELKDSVRADPLVQAVLTRFPGAEIVDVRPPAGAVSGDGGDAAFHAPAEPDIADDET